METKDLKNIQGTGAIVPGGTGNAQQVLDQMGSVDINALNLKVDTMKRSNILMGILGMLNVRNDTTNRMINSISDQQ